MDEYVDPHTNEGFHLLARVQYFLELQVTKKPTLQLNIHKLHGTIGNIN